MPAITVQAGASTPNAAQSRLFAIAAKNSCTARKGLSFDELLEEHLP
jgi:hypothetical protein